MLPLHRQHSCPVFQRVFFGRFYLVYKESNRLTYNSGNQCVEGAQVLQYKHCHHRIYLHNRTVDHYVHEHLLGHGQWLFVLGHVCLQFLFPDEFFLSFCPSLFFFGDCHLLHLQKDRGEGLNPLPLHFISQSLLGDLFLRKVLIHIDQILTVQVNQQVSNLLHLNLGNLVESLQALANKGSINHCHIFVTSQLEI